MASKALFAGLHVEVFTKLSNAPRSVPSLMEDMPPGVTERKLTTLLTCLVSIGLLQKEGELFANVPAAEAFLVKGAKYDFGDYLRLSGDYLTIIWRLSSDYSATTPRLSGDYLLAVWRLSIYGDNLATLGLTAR